MNLIESTKADAVPVATQALLPSDASTTSHRGRFRGRCGASSKGRPKAFGIWIALRQMQDLLRCRFDNCVRYAEVRSAFHPPWKLFRLLKIQLSRLLPIRNCWNRSENVFCRNSGRASVGKAARSARKCKSMPPRTSVAAGNRTMPGLSSRLPYARGAMSICRSAWTNSKPRCCSTLKKQPKLFTKRFGLTPQILARRTRTPPSPAA